MTAPRGPYTLRMVASALGVSLRRVRGWADAGRLDTLQDAFHAERLVPASELRRLERKGYRVAWRELGMATSATSATAVPDEITEEDAA